jgi:AAA domain-containing protein
MTDKWTEEEMISDAELYVEDNLRRVKQAKRANGNGGNKQPRFTLLPFEAITLSTAPNYLVKGVIPRVGIVVVWGPPKCGKSFWTFDLFMHVALGWAYRGRRVQQGVVVYLALEGGHGFRNRVDAWRRRHLADHHDAVPFYLLDVPVDLIADRNKLIQDIKDQLGEQVPVAVVIDTLNRALIGDENKPEDMAKFVRAADMIRMAFGCAVPIIHHCGVQGSRPRGHTSLSGADDAQIAIERDKDGNIIAKVEHMKDAEAGAVIACRLERVDLGNDDDGDPLSSCVIVPAEGVVADKGPKLSKVNHFALDLLQRLIEVEGQPAPIEAKLDGVRVCPVAKWRERFNETYPADKRDTKKKAYLRAVLELKEANFIELWREYVWLRDKRDKRDK